jgi:hypothetical protein
MHMVFCHCAFYQCHNSNSFCVFIPQPKRSAQFSLNSDLQTPPAFVCDSFSVQLSTRDIDTLQQSAAAASSPADPQPNDKSPTAEQLDQVHRRRSVRALHAALGRVTDVPHSALTTRVDFVVSCSEVTQHVNMSLLRLTHQIVTMVENINKTRSELRKNAAARATLLKTHSSTWMHSDIRRALSSATRAPTAAEQHQKNKQSANASALTRPDTLPGVQSGRIRADIAAQASPSFTISMDTEPTLNAGGDASSPAIAEERTIVDEIRENTPKCWRTLYHLLDLYSTMPELKTVSRSQLSVIEEEEHNSPAGVCSRRRRREDEAVGTQYRIGGTTAASDIVQSYAAIAEKAICHWHFYTE